MVDFAIARQSDVHLFSKFNIITMSEVSDYVKHLISDRRRIPDHSILVCDLIISAYTRGNTLPVDTKQPCDKSRYAFKIAKSLSISRQTNTQSFWRNINRLQKRKECNIPIGIYLDGQLAFDLELAVKQWLAEYKSLYNTCHNNSSDNYISKIVTYQIHKMKTLC